MDLNEIPRFFVSLWDSFLHWLKNCTRSVVNHQVITYDVPPLSPVSSYRLAGVVARKIMVLDLDETLIHSRHGNTIRHPGKIDYPADFIINVALDRHNVRFAVYKRPHVDLFLDICREWFELVVFTASMESYGTLVVDALERDGLMVARRYFRQDCRRERGAYTKDLTMIEPDLGRVFIVDNNPDAYRYFQENAVPIKSWFSDQTDIALLNLLPMLDAMRFCSDVRNVLKHRTAPERPPVPLI